jgi:small-conductance mechanosensitive channel
MHRFFSRLDSDELLAASLAALIVLVLSMVLRRFVLARLAALAAKTTTGLDDLAVRFLESIRGWGWVALALAAGARMLTLSSAYTRLVHHSLVLVLSLQLGIALQAVIELAVEQNRKREGRPSAATTVAAVGAMSRLVVWSLVVVLALSNLGVEVATLAATLGVGGLAAAFAVQNILGDLFASLSIYLDRPFDLGDAIQVDELSGVVESISWRSTRIRSASGEQLVFSNGELNRARIRNYRRLSERRILLTFRLPLDTDVALLEALPGKVRALVGEQKEARFERAHITDVGESALTFELVLWSTSDAYERMLDLKQAIIVGVRRILDEANVPLAVPARVHIERRASS